MSTPASTVAVVLREAFSPTPATLTRILACTPEPRRVVVVDGGSPARIRRRLDALAAAHDLTLIRSDAVLHANEARNLVLPHVDTEFVAFVDNDTIVGEGWLDALERCARETGAAAVNPVVLWGPSGHDRVHFAGGTCHLDAGPGARRLVDHNTHIHRSVDTLDGLARRPSELVEFHCLLVRADALHRIGPFDETLVAAREEPDFCHRLAAVGGSAWIEPGVVVGYPTPKRLRRGDRMYYRARWSDQWAARAFDAFNAKWELDDTDTVDERFRHGHRERRVGAYPWNAPGWRGRAARLAWKVRRAVDLVATPAAVHLADRRRQAAPPPRVAHRASWDVGPTGGAST